METAQLAVCVMDSVGREKNKQAKKQKLAC